jgi:PadR family transcriptional regulator, regulatory protein AphA
MELSPTAKVILGMVSFGKHTGYEIKQFVDRTARHFMAASYGQIYPELRRLEEAGLIAGAAQPSGGRARTVYELTGPGRRALEQWLASDAELMYELRDEGMLKLFFSDFAPARRSAILCAMRDRNDRKLAQLHALEPEAANGPDGARLTLELGISFTEAINAWLDTAQRRLAAEA